MATVLTLAPRGMVTIQSSDGARYEVVRGTGWQVGDTVTCEHSATGGPRLASPHVPEDFVT